MPPGSATASLDLAWAGGWTSSRIVLAQKTTAKIANRGHSNVYAQLSAFPASARRSCQLPSQSIPTTLRITNACQPSHLGEMRNLHREDSRVPDMRRV